MAKFVIPTKVITGPCIFSYLNCWDPKAINGGTPKFLLVTWRHNAPAIRTTP